MSTLLFVLVAAALAAVALAFVLPTLLRARRGSATVATINTELFRQETAELEREVAQGELPSDAFLEERDELRRRLLEDRRTPHRPSPRLPGTRAVAVIVAVALPLIAAAVYLMVGKPDVLTEAPQKSGQGDYIALLKSHLERQPRDARGWVLLARAQADAGDFANAAASFKQALAASPKVQRDPSVLCEYADALGMAQGGRLGGQPSELIAQALAIAPKHPRALEMAGSAAYAEGRYSDAVRHWRSLLAQLPAASEPHQELSAAVARAERRAAVALRAP